MIVQKNNKINVKFDLQKIAIAASYAIISIENQNRKKENKELIKKDPDIIPKQIKSIGLEVANKVKEMLSSVPTITVDLIHNKVEEALLTMGHPKYAHEYVRYRYQRLNDRKKLVEKCPKSAVGINKETIPFPIKFIEKLLYKTTADFPDINAQDIFNATFSKFDEEMTHIDIAKTLANTTAELFTEKYNYDHISARILSYAIGLECYLTLVKYEKLDKSCIQELIETNYPIKMQGYNYLAKYLELAVESKRIDPALIANFDLEKIEIAMTPKVNLYKTYQGIKNQYDRYLTKTEKNERFETTHMQFMRAAMGHVANNKHYKTKEEKTKFAIELYNVYANQLGLSSTPTLFNSGTLHPQMSSCYLLEAEDSIQGIYHTKTLAAQLGKYAGGLGTSFTKIRGTDSYIKGTNGRAKGSIELLKTEEKETKYVDQGGKRKGARCSVMESWHIDFPEFMRMRDPNAPETIRIEQMNVAGWHSDLFMKRVIGDKPWSLFCPNQAKNLNDLYGKDFEIEYERLEKKALSYTEHLVEAELQIKGKTKAKVLKATMRHPMYPFTHILTQNNGQPSGANFLYVNNMLLFKAGGHPWITFKDTCNIRSPQNHVGIVHSSNLCTEITLNTSATTFSNKSHEPLKIDTLGEVAVCNLASICLPSFVIYKKNKPVGIDMKLMEKTIGTMVEALDNVIDVNYYPIAEAYNSNKKHRPIGLGIMGWHQLLQKLHIPYESEIAIELADSLQEHILFYTISKSNQLAQERGSYKTFKGSKWEKGIFPIDTQKLVEEERGSEFCDFDYSSVLGEKWDELKQKVKETGLRNSNMCAIAPTASIGKLLGVFTPSIDPAFKILYTEGDLSGNFKRFNPEFEKIMKERGIWRTSTPNDINANDGSIQNIEYIPDDIKDLHKIAFEIDPKFMVRQTSRRQKWIDQAQSFNLFLHADNKKGMSNAYKQAWIEGVKTTYYCRFESATRKEKVGINQTREEANANASATNHKYNKNTKTLALQNNNSNPIITLQPEPQELIEPPITYSFD